MNKQRPNSISWFERLYWASVILSYVGDYSIEGRLFELLLADLMVLGIAILFWYMIARQSNDVFKWLYAVLAFVGFGVLVLALIASVIKLSILDNELLGMSATEIAFGITTNILGVGAAICLFLKPSRDWFETQGEVFNADDSPPDMIS